jgi:hypothetical protein
MSMGEFARVGDLQVPQDPDFQRREWWAQRVGRVVMAMVVAGGIVGLFGSGPLSRATATDAGGLRVDYGRFERVQAPTTLRIHVHPRAVSAGRAEIWIDRDYLLESQVVGVDPAPAAVAVTADRMVYAFDVPEPTRPAVVVVHLRLQRAGLRTGRVGAATGLVSFRQLVYP